MKKIKYIVIGLALLLVLTGIGTAWAPDLPPESLTARWAPPPSQFLAIDGMRVHVRDEGRRDDPEPILLLHGTSASLHTWDGWTDVLKDQHRVIRADMPGFGLTGPSPDGNYDAATYTHFVIALLDHLGIQNVVLAGNSLGGFVAWKTALEHPDRISRLILVDAGGYAAEAESIPIGFRLVQIPALAPLITHFLPRRTIESSLRNVYGDPSRIIPELVDRYYELTLRAGNREAVIRRFQQMKAGEDEQRIAAVKQPTLILWGGRDRLIPTAYAERFHQDIADSHLVIFDTLGHVPHEEGPERTVAAVREFLAKR